MSGLATKIKWGKDLRVTDLGDDTIKVDIVRGTGLDGSGSGTSKRIKFGDNLRVINLGGHVILVNADYGAPSSGGSGSAHTIEFGEFLGVTDLGAGEIQVDVLHGWLYKNFPRPDGIADVTNANIKAVNNDGIALVNLVAAGIPRSFSWDVVTDEVHEYSPLSGYDMGALFDINDDGIVAGYCSKARPDINDIPALELTATVWTAHDTPVAGGPSYDDAPATIDSVAFGDIPVNFFGTWATAINNSGTIAGNRIEWATSFSGFYIANSSTPFIGSTLLDSLHTSSYAAISPFNGGLWAFNDSGHAAGSQRNMTWDATTGASSLTSYDTWYYDGTDVTLIHSEPDSSEVHYLSAHDMNNDDGVVLVDDWTVVSTAHRSIKRWSPGSSLDDLDSPTTDTSTLYVAGINNNGDIVWGNKVSSQVGETATGFLEVNNSLFPWGDDFTFPDGVSTFDISDSGIAVGVGPAVGSAGAYIQF